MGFAIFGLPELLKSFPCTFANRINHTKLRQIFDVFDISTYGTVDSPPMSLWSLQGAYIKINSGKFDHPCKEERISKRYIHFCCSYRLACYISSGRVTHISTRMLLFNDANTSGQKGFRDWILR